MMASAVWIVLGTWSSGPVVAIGLALFLVATLVLLVRMVRGIGDGRWALDQLGELRGPSFDYIVWMAIGAPMVMVVLLVLLLVTGGLTTGR